MDIFCNASTVLIDQIISETSHFYVIHDGYPLCEGHLLIIPKKHVDCILHIDKKYQNELFALKKNVTLFLTHYYKAPVIFEHGIIGQTILHAHIHFVPTKKSILSDIKKIGKVLPEGKVPYFYYEENGKSYYYRPLITVKDGFLHTSFAKVLNRPLVGILRAPDAKQWILQVKEKWKIWQRDKKQG